MSFSLLVSLIIHGAPSGCQIRCQAVDIIRINLQKVSHSVMSDSLRSHGLYVAHQAPLFLKFSWQEYLSGFLRWLETWVMALASLWLPGPQFPHLSNRGLGHMITMCFSALTFDQLNQVLHFNLLSRRMNTEAHFETVRCWRVFLIPKPYVLLVTFRFSWWHTASSVVFASAPLSHLSFVDDLSLSWLPTFTSIRERHIPQI